MSRIEQLIAELCPDGVEYKDLSSITKITTGKLNANAMKSDGLYPFFTCSEKPYLIDNYAFDTEAILISGNGSQLGHINYFHGKFNAYQRTYVLYDFSKSISTSYLIHYLKGYLREYIWKNVKEGSVPYITLPMLQNFILPIPPLPIQQEIVRILDTFTDLDAELQAELEARKKQYEHYRNQLLNFEGKEVEWKSIVDCFELKNGYTPSKSKSEYWENGNIPWFRMEDIRKNGRILSDAIQHITPEAVKSKLFPSNSILLATTATIGEHALITVPSLANQQFTYITLRKSFESKINMKYFYYFMFIVDEWCKNNTNVSGFSSVDMAKFRKLLIPIPSLSEQERIVSILDKFEALVNDELPAEIDARRKQYEYYREKLLAFEPLVS